MLKNKKAKSANKLPFLTASLAAMALFLLTAELAYPSSSASWSTSSSTIDVEKISWGGPGCTGSGKPLKLTYSEGLKKLFVFLPELKADATDKSIDRKACSLALPLDVPEGKMLVIGRPTIWGQSTLSGGAAGLVQGEIFLAGDMGVVVAKDLLPKFWIRTAHFSVEEQLTAIPCGSQGTIRMNLSVLAKSASQGDAADVSITGASFIVQLKDCPNDLP